MQPEVALVVELVPRVLVFVLEDFQDHVRKMWICDYLLMFMESVLRSLHRVQPEVGILSGLQLGVVQYFVPGHATGIENAIVKIALSTLLFRRPRHRRLTFPRTVRPASGCHCLFRAREWRRSSVRRSFTTLWLAWC